jgi:hypothetical protein
MIEAEEARLKEREKATDQAKKTQQAEEKAAKKQSEASSH